MSGATESQAGESTAGAALDELTAAPGAARARLGRLDGWRRRGADSHPERLVGAVTRQDRLALAVLAALWLASAAFFWLWWLEPAHRSTVAGLVVNSAVLAFDLVVVPAWFFFFLLRMRRPAPALDVPHRRPAISVTKARRPGSSGQAMPITPTGSFMASARPRCSQWGPAGL